MERLLMLLSGRQRDCMSINAIRDTTLSPIKLEVGVPLLRYVHASKDMMLPAFASIFLNRCISTFSRHFPLTWMFSHWHREPNASLLGTRLRDVVLTVLDKPGISCRHMS
jgi:hypothetical protein